MGRSPLAAFVDLSPVRSQSVERGGVFFCPGRLVGARIGGVWAKRATVGIWATALSAAGGVCS